MAAIFRINPIALPYHTEEQMRVTDGLQERTEQQKIGTERQKQAIEQVLLDTRQKKRETLLFPLPKF